MSPYIVRITDEFESTYSFETDSKKESLKIVKEWIDNSDETPIYEITIELNNQ